MTIRSIFFPAALVVVVSLLGFPADSDALDLTLPSSGQQQWWPPAAADSMTCVLADVCLLTNLLSTKEKPAADPAHPAEESGRQERTPRAVGVPLARPATPTPEPENWMLLGGLLLMGSMARRRYLWCDAIELPIGTLAPRDSPIGLGRDRQPAHLSSIRYVQARPLSSRAIGI